MKFKVSHSLLVVLCGITVLIGGAAVYAFNQGKVTGARSLERVSLVWPNILSMPKQDRALIAGLGITCKLEDQPLEEAAVIACLRDGFWKKDALIPKGMDRTSASERLEALLSEREQKGTVTPKA